MPVKQLQESGGRTGPLRSVAVHASVHGHAQAVVITATGGTPPAAEVAAPGVRHQALAAAHRK